jgi:hypothetical protein
MGKAASFPENGGESTSFPELPITYYGEPLLVDTPELTFIFIVLALSTFRDYDKNGDEYFDKKEFAVCSVKDGAEEIA